MTWTLQTEEECHEEVANAGHLKQRLLELHDLAKSQPFFAMLNAPDGSCLRIGLGRELSVLSYAESGGWPAKHVEVGSIDEGLINFTFFGHFSEMPIRYAVPLADALNAAIAFFESSRLDDTLPWEDD